MATGFAAYLECLAQAAGHLDRSAPLKSYCAGLPIARRAQEVEPIAARLCPDNVRQAHLSLHHIVAQAPSRDQDPLEAVREYVLPAKAGTHRRLGCG
jgi:SRSO17 transposase